MRIAETEKNWSDANQRYLVAELARLKRRLGAEGDDAPIDAELGAARAALPTPAAIDTVAQLFGLSDFERDLLLLCAGVEMDAELARLCAGALAHAQRGHATFGIALAALENSHWSALAAAGPLRRWRLIEFDDSAGLTAGRLRIDERVLHYLAGVNYLDPRLRPLLQAVAPPTVMAPAQRQVCDSLLAELRAAPKPFPVVLLHGDDEDGQSDVAAAAAAQLGLQLQRVYAEDLPANSAEIDALATLWQREAALLGAALLVHSRDGTVPAAAINFAERIGALLFLAGREAPSLKRASARFTVNKPRAEEQKELWQEALGAASARLNGALDGVAAQFHLSAQRILATGSALRAEAAAGDRGHEWLWRACREASRARLDDLAQRIEPAAGWEDLILPEAQKITLRQIAAHARHRLTVYQRWGFAAKGARGLGISALFAGESGTGKTMAAEVLANQLHLDLYRIDLASVVSKYIGDTEKNLRRVFDAAEDSGAILLFDEADALFGKRSEVRDSHDRYANIEVSYLLQRMEAYRGLAILTTNMKSALDVAFQRRLSFVVQFPFPDQQQRELIWRGVFPKATPVEQLDCAKLARLSMSGGNIRNVALNAAFLAADEGTPVRMKHLLQAAHSEAAKRDRPLSDAETRGWV
jgi:ATPase family associated with various cellular activities (AAA)/Winged helix domain, variant